jgi:hypothetical protein
MKVRNGQGVPPQRGSGGATALASASIAAASLGREGAAARGGSAFGAGDGSGVDAGLLAHAHTSPRRAHPRGQRRDGGEARVIAAQVSNRRRSGATPASRGTQTCAPRPPRARRELDLRRRFRVDSPAAREKVASAPGRAPTGGRKDSAMARIKVLLAATAVAAATFTASNGHAQTHTPIGEKGQFIISADRLVPLFSWSRVARDVLPGMLPANAQNEFTTNTQTSFSFFWGSAFNTTQPATVFFAIPRVGFDYVVIPRLTIGTDLALFVTADTHTSDETDFNNGSTTVNSSGNGTLFAFGVAPRVGYMIRISDLLTFWPRGGLSFYTFTAIGATQADGSTTHDNTNQLALDLEPQLVITPVSHFGFTAAIDGDIPLYGRHAVTRFNGNGSTNSVAVNSSIAFFGITLGMLGYF